MSGTEGYVFLAILIFTINVVPAFMPPTWVVLSFLYVAYHLALIPTVLLGVVAATLGRFALALIARRWFKQILPKKWLHNYEDLGLFLEKNQQLTVPIVIGYAFSPISSNSLFIVSGLSNMKLNIVLFSFFIGRLATYSFWVTAARHFEKQLDSIFLENLLNPKTILSAVVSLAIVVAVGKVKWGKVLHLQTNREKKNE